MKLSILICTTVERTEMFTKLYSEFMGQIYELDLEDKIEVLFIKDNKEVSVGEKRQRLLEMSQAEWVCYFDDDDFPYPYYIEEVWKAINQPNIDCVGINIYMTTNGGNPQRCCHSLKYPVWEDKKDGWDYVRNITHFNPCKRKIASLVGFNDKHFGEDKEYSDVVTLLCTNEYYIEKPLFHYRYTTHQSHNEKYGIK